MAKALFLVGMGLLSLLLGAFAALTPELTARIALVLPVVLVIVVALFQDAETDLKARATWLLLLMLFLVTVVWPPYLVVKRPGLPMLDPRRIFALASMLFLVYMFASRRVVRERLFGLRGISLFVFLLLVLLTVVRFATAFTSPYGISAVSLVFWEFSGYVVVALIALLLVRNAGVPDQLLKLFYWSILLCAVIAISEVVTGRSLLIEALGRFSAADDATTNNLMLTRVRDGALRAQGPFIHPLVLTEFGCLVFPFAAAHLLWGANQTSHRSSVGRGLHVCALLASIICIVASGSRSGAICVLVSVIWLLVIRLTSARRGVRLGVFEASLRLTLVVSILVGVALAVAPTVADILKGKSRAQSESTEARVIMLKRGIAAITDSPFFGSGVGTGVEIAGMKGRAGVLTLDNYLLLVTIESGLVFGILFLIFLVVPIVWFGQRVVTGKAVIAPFQAGVSAALLSILIIRSILSINDNLPLVYLLIGLVGLFSTKALENSKSAGATVRFSAKS